MTLFKEYQEIEINGENHTISFTVTFNRESTSWATGKSIPIGYRVSVIPVKLSKRGSFTMEEFGAFTGFNDTLLEIERQSQKRLQTALAILKSRKTQYLNYFTNNKI